MKNKLIAKAFGYQLLFAALLFIAFSLYFPVFIQDASILRDEFQEYQQDIPQIDPYESDQVNQLDQEVGDISTVVQARNNLLLNTSILFIFLLVASSVIFAYQRKLFNKKQDLKKTILILLGAQLGLFVFSLFFLVLASYLAASFGLIENDTTFYISFAILGILYSYAFILFYVQNKAKIKHTLKVHSVFVVIGLLYMFIFSKIMQLAISGSILGTVLLILALFLGYAIVAYEKYLLFEK